MAYAPSPEPLVHAWEAAFPKSPNAERRKMFGYPAGFVNGNMFGGLWQSSVVVRLPEDDRDECVADGALPFEPNGRSMKEYVVLPDAIARDRGRLRRWLELAFAYASELPPKVLRVSVKTPSEIMGAVSRTSPPNAARGPRKTVPRKTVPPKTVPPKTVPPKTVPRKTVPPKSVPPKSSGGTRNTSAARPAAKRKA